MSFFTLTDNLVGSGSTGAQTLLTGNTGNVVIYGVGITIVAIVVGGLFYIFKIARANKG